MIHQSNESVTAIKDMLANPSPLGLLDFGMIDVLLNLHNAGSEGTICGRVILTMCPTK